MKNGFTLIELLAVIVVLAIIALIAVPVVLNIINDAKESSLLRSVEFYLDAVEYTIADAFLYHGGLSNGEYPITEDGDICKKSLPCDDANILKVEVNGDKPTGGSITVNGGNISNVSLVLDEKKIVKNADGELVYQTSPCKKITGDKTTPGSKYSCEVKPGTKYNFYVLSQEDDGTTNLIMDRNICGDGTPTEEGKTCLAAYNSSGDSSGTGPVTAMNFLNNATSSWKNIDNLNITYDDEGGHFSKFAINVKARLPRYDEVHGEGKCLTYSENGNKHGSCPLWFSNYLNSSSYVTGEGLQNISGIYGYWTLSSIADYSYGAWSVSFNGIVGYNYVDNVSNFGVRAVINLKI